MTTQLLTTAVGAPVGDNQNSQTAGPRGPVTLQDFWLMDFWLIEKLAHFDREVIPERRVHAKGSGAFGTFRVTHDISRYTKAKLFDAIGKETRSSCAFQPSRANAVPPTPNATCADSPSSSIRKKATGTWSATTRRCSSSAIRSSFRTSSTRKSAIRTPTCAATSPRGISGRVIRNRCIR